jgi:hypothetical protein
MRRLQERSAKDLFRHDTPSWMDLVHQLNVRTRGSASGCPVVVMVQPTHDWKSDHFAPCIPRGRNRAAPLRDLLLDALMRPCLVKVRHISIEDAVELPLMEDQHMVQAFLSDTPQETFADSIGSGCMNRRFEDLDSARFRHTSKARPKLTVVITNQILGCLPIRGRFSKLLCDPRIGRRSCHPYMDDLP